MHQYILALNLALNDTAIISINTTTTAQSPLVTLLFTRNISIYSSANNKNSITITTATTTIAYQHSYQYYHAVLLWLTTTTTAVTYSFLIKIFLLCKLLLTNSSNPPHM